MLSERWPLWRKKVSCFYNNYYSVPRITNQTITTPQTNWSADLNYCCPNWKCKIKREILWNVIRIIIFDHTTFSSIGFWSKHWRNCCHEDTGRLWMMPFEADVQICVFFPKSRVYASLWFVVYWRIALWFRPLTQHVPSILSTLIGKRKIKP